MHAISVQQARSCEGLMQAYRELSGSSRWLIPLMLVLLFADALIHAAVPALTGYIVDALVHDTAQFVTRQLPWFIAGTLGGVLFFYTIASTHHYLMQFISQRIGVQVQVKLYEHIQRLSADFFQRNHVGEIISRLTNDIGQGVTPLFTNMMVMFWALCVLVISCVTMAFISTPLLLVFLAVSLCMVVLTKVVSKQVQRLTREVRDEGGRINARMTETVAASALIRTFAREAAFVDGLRGHTDVYLGKLRRTIRLTVLFTDIMNTFMAFLAPMVMLLVGVIFVGQHGITVGALVAAFGYWRTVSGPISAILGNITALFTSFASIERIREYFRQTPLVEDAPEAQELAVTDGTIEVCDVSFRYPIDAEAPVLDGLNLTIPGRRSLALVGESGAGKSTITQLLLRFYDPQAGEIRIDGQELRDVSQASLRRQIGYVMQETILLSGSIRENLLLAKPEATDEEIIEVLMNAEAWDFVQALPHGLDTELGERGARLSGGQKQRLAIARVFLKNPPIVIFDEATSALDAVTEAQIQQTMARLLADRTAIIIAHRLSTVINCDAILLLDHGQVVAHGPHEDLLATCPQYRELCEKQLVAI